MDSSRHYSKRIGKIIKKNFDQDISKFKNEFQEAFVSCFNYVPEDMANELFNKFVTYSDREFKDALYNLVNVFELFEENYDMDNDPLNSEEWLYLKLLINDGSDDIDLETIKYVMQVMLDLDQI